LPRWKNSGTVSKLAGIFVRKATRQRVAFSFAQDGSKPKPNRFELPRQIVKWADDSRAFTIRFANASSFPGRFRAVFSVLTGCNKLHRIYVCLLQVIVNKAEIQFTATLRNYSKLVFINS
jgi:hypothetical protein